MLLPHINEDLALKIIQRRPISSIEDLYRLPYINIDRIKEIWKGSAKFTTESIKHDTDKNLKQ